MRIVAKFGGTSVKDADMMKQVREIVAGISKEGNEIVVVVSAMAGVTDMLLGELKKLPEQTEEEVSAFVNTLHAKHEEALKKSAPKKWRKSAEEVKSLTEKLRETLISLRHTGCTDRSKDFVAAFGEKLSAVILSACISEKKRVKYFYGDGGLIMTTGEFGDAKPLMELTRKNVKEKVLPLLKKKTVPVITGFMGCTKEGYTTTLGRGSSDYIASIVGACIDAGEIQIWTDVDGILTASPKIVKNAKLLESVSFMEASEIAYFGAKVLHPKTILPAMDKDIPVRILNTYNPSCKGTLIVSRGPKKEKTLKAITAKKGVYMIDITSPSMLGMPGFLSRVFDIFHRYEVSIDTIATSEISVSLTVDDHRNLNGVMKELEQFSGARLIKDRASVCVIGQGTRQTPGIIGRIFSCMGEKGINVEVISMGASEISTTFIVKDEDAEKAVIALHDEFFPEVAK